MTSGRNIRFVLASTSLGALLLGACSPNVVNHGYRLDAEKLATIRPGVTSREEVLRTLGSPSSVAAFDPRLWFYISQKEEHSSFYRQELVAQDVVSITFDTRGIVAKVDQQGLDQANAIAPSSDKTKTAGNEITIMQQIFGNIGRFSNGETGGAGPSGAPPGR